MKSKKEFLEDLKKFETKLGFNPTEISQGSDEWHKMKLGVLSASKADCILAKKTTAKYQTYLSEKIAEICTGQSHSISASSLRYGIENEASAIDAYAFHKEVEVYQLPFIYNDSQMRVGCSPDGFIVGQDKIIEIKCPANSANHINTLFDNTIKPEYQKQVQFQLWVTGCEQADFVSYNDRMKKDMIAVVNVGRDDKTISLLQEAASEFIYLMDKKLISRGFKFGQQWSNE